MTDVEDWVYGFVQSMCDEDEAFSIDDQSSALDWDEKMPEDDWDQLDSEY